MLLTNRIYNTKSPIHKTHTAITLLLFFIFISLSASSQKPTYKHYSAENGLPSNQVYYAMQDSKGYIWFSTDNGVSRFNGYEFENFDKEDGLADNTIFYVYEDFKDRIWFISFSCQLSYFYNDSIYKYKYNDLLADTLVNKTEITNSSFYVDSTETIHFGTLGQGIFSIDKNGILETIIEDLAATYKVIDNKVVITANNNFYNDAETGISIIDEDENRKYNIEDFDVEIGSKRLNGFKLNNNQLLYSNGRNVYVIKDREVKTIYESHNNVVWVGKDINSNLWLSLFNSGVNCYKNLNVDTTPTNYLKEKTITSVLTDKDGGVWMTAFDGVYYYPSLIINNIGSDILQNKRVNCIEIGNNNEVWFATNSTNIYNLKNNNIHNYTSDISGYINSLNYNKTLKNVFYTGTNLFGYTEGNKLIDRNYFKEISSEGTKYIKNLFFKQIIKISDTLYWYIGSEIGKINTNTNTLNILSREEKISEFFPLCIHYSSDSILYIGCKEGLWKYENKRFEHISENNSLLESKIVDITEDNDHNLWLATKGNGIIVLTNDTTIHITEKDGLSSNAVNSLHIKDNTVWAGTMHGLNKINIDDSINYKIERIYQYHGIASDIINDVVADNGKLYIATDKGLSFFDYSLFKLNNNETPVYIKNVSIAEKDTLLLNSYNLDYTQNTISIEFIGLNFRNTGNINYKYRLKGIDDDWVKTKNRVVRYPSLQKGNYTFEVVALNENGEWGNNPATIDFSIAPPFWKTWWFISLIVLSSLLIVSTIFFTIYYIKVCEIKKRSQLQDKLNRLRQEALAQQMNPHFVFNTLASIQYFISRNDKESSINYLTMFSHLMRMTLDNSFKRLISIDNEIDALDIYIKLEQLRFSSKFDYKITIDNSINRSKNLIPSLILQPFVENAIWHGLMHKKEGKGLLEIDLRTNQQSIICTIKDNGIGRKRSAEINSNRDKYHKSLGTKITEARLKLINSSDNNNLIINYTDLVNDENEASGTMVKISLPIITGKSY